MTPAELAAHTALEDLRRWASTDRATLVAAAWRAGNRNISRLAAAAGVHRVTIYEDLRTHEINPATDRKEPPVPTTTTTNDWTELPVPGWRHPNLLYVATRKTWAGREYQFSLSQPFTGAEPRPKLPDEWNDVHPTDSNLQTGQIGSLTKLWSQREAEIRLLRTAWVRARFVREVRRLLASSDYAPAADAWNAYTAARDTLKAAYAALDATPDNMWRAALLKIHDATGPAEQAAKDWDRVAEGFANLSAWLLEENGEEEWHGQCDINAAAATHGVDTSEWLIECLEDYSSSWGRTPACEQIHRIIEAGNARIRAVRDHMGDPDTENDD